MKTLHIEGFANKIDLTTKLDDNYDVGLSFDFNEESIDTIPNIFLRIYSCDNKCSLENCIEKNIKQMFGELEATGQEYGYSEYTVEGFIVNSLKLGGHDLANIIKGFKNKYLHILVDQVIT